MSQGISPLERVYLDAQQLGRLATVDARGRPHVAPVGYTFNETTGTLDIGGFHICLLYTSRCV